MARRNSLVVEKEKKVSRIISRRKKAVERWEKEESEDWWTGKGEGWRKRRAKNKRSRASRKVNRRRG